MRSNRLVSLIAILILILAACSAGGEEPAASEAGQTTTPESGLATIVPTADGNRIEEAEMTMENEEASTDADENTSSEEDVIAPVEVDLSEVTPEALDADDQSGEAVEMPEPGRPKPQIAMVSQAKQDLAERLGIDEDDVEVVEVEEMQWSDSSLGCPASDGQYLQVITLGFRITLSAQSEAYNYHTDTGRTVVLCGPDGRPVPYPS